MASDDMGNLPEGGLKAFATWATENDSPEKQAFRKAAAINLRDAIAKSSIPLPALTSEEIEYCEGWIYLARKDLGVTDPGKLDQHLVDLAKSTLANGQIHVMNG